MAALKVVETGGDKIIYKKFSLTVFPDSSLWNVLLYGTISIKHRNRNQNRNASCYSWVKSIAPLVLRLTSMYKIHPVSRWLSVSN